MSKGLNSNSHTIASGVDELIGRLRDEGVEEGRARAEKVIDEAEARATWIVAQAREEADGMLEKALLETKRNQQATEEALRTAARDALLSVKAELTHRFTGKVRRLVSDSVSKEAMLEKMILELVGRMRDDIDEAEPVEVILPRDVIGIDDLRRKIGELKEGVLSQFVQAQATDMVREGVDFGISQEDGNGFHLRLSNGEIELDLSDRALADLLLEHLQPRFRALLEGIVG
jgi:V/A-type H+-transporting ATPase subunit E